MFSVRSGVAWAKPLLGSRNAVKDLQQGLEIHGLKECGPWRYTVLNWFSKHLRYADFD
jgi:hypothetical protein